MPTHLEGIISTVNEWSFCDRARFYFRAFLFSTQTLYHQMWLLSGALFRETTCWQEANMQNNSLFVAACIFHGILMRLVEHA